VLANGTNEVLAVQVANGYSISAILKSLKGMEWWNLMYFVDVDDKINNLKRNVDLEEYCKDQG
jgi:hypothetical protein